MTIMVCSFLVYFDFILYYVNLTCIPLLLVYLDIPCDTCRKTVFFLYIKYCMANSTLWTVSCISIITVYIILNLWFLMYIFMYNRVQCNSVDVFFRWFVTIIFVLLTLYLITVCIRIRIVWDLMLICVNDTDTTNSCEVFCLFHVHMFK